MLSLRVAEFGIEFLTVKLIVYLYDCHYIVRSYYIVQSCDYMHDHTTYSSRDFSTAKNAL